MGTDNNVVLNDNWILHNGKLRDLMAVRSVVGKVFLGNVFFVGIIPQGKFPKSTLSVRFGTCNSCRIPHDFAELFLI